MSTIWSFVSSGDLCFNYQPHGFRYIWIDRRLVWMCPTCERHS